MNTTLQYLTCNFNATLSCRLNEKLNTNKTIIVGECVSDLPLVLPTKDEDNSITVPFPKNTNELNKLIDSVADNLSDLIISKIKTNGGKRILAISTHKKHIESDILLESKDFKVDDFSISFSKHLKDYSARDYIISSIRSLATSTGYNLTATKMSTMALYDFLMDAYGITQSNIPVFLTVAINFNYQIIE